MTGHCGGVSSLQSKRRGCEECKSWRCVSTSHSQKFCPTGEKKGNIVYLGDLNFIRETLGMSGFKEGAARATGIEDIKGAALRKEEMAVGLQVIWDEQP
jgi:hypothetical protein